MSAAEPLSVTLPEPWPSRVRGGIPYIDRTDVGPDFAPVESSDPLVLRGANYEPVGLGFWDAEQERLWTLPTEGEQVFDEKFIGQRIKPAVGIRRRLGLFTPDSACRLVNGEGDGLSGFFLDWYAGHVVIYTLSSALDRFVPLVAKVAAGIIKPTSILSKVRPPGEIPTGKIPYRMEVGDEPPAEVVVREDDVAYEVHLTGGINTGLFCDMRDVRRELKPWFSGKRVLNTFSYTGSFSVVAALHGAKSVTSVDFATGVLDWTKTNFSLNQLSPTDKRFKFVRDDVFEFLKFTRRHEKQFDVVILDPPTTTTVPGRRWFLKSDYGRLIGHALKVTTPGGLLVVAASSPTSRPDKLESQIREAAREAGTRVRLVGSPSLPADFPTQMIHPAARYLKCYFLLTE